MLVVCHCVLSRNMQLGRVFLSWEFLDGWKDSEEVRK